MFIAEEQTQGLCILAKGFNNELPPNLHLVAF